MDRTPIQANRPLLSVVAPFHNEQEVITLFASELRAVLDPMDISYEVVLVDDGSRDSSWDLVAALQWPELRAIKLQRNTGHMIAISAGLDQARGDFVVTLDSDLQHPPQLIPTLLATAQRERVDVVYGVRGQRREDTVFKRNTARSYYWLVSRLTGVRMVENAAEFRLMTRRVVEIVCAIPERTKVYRLLLPELGFSHATVPFEANLRAGGTPSYSLRRMVGLAWSSIVGFSSVPLRVIATFGGVVAGLSFLWLFFVFGVYFAGITIPGWASLFVAVLMLGGIQLVALGMLGEYVARIYDASKGRPPYLVAEMSVPESRGSHGAGSGPSALNLGGTSDVQEGSRVGDWAAEAR